MANPFITQNGVVFARKTDSSFTSGTGRREIDEDMVTSDLVATLDTTAPFDAILDEQGTYWRLRDRDVVYGADNVKVNLYTIYEIRDMITRQATIQVQYNDGGNTSSMTLSRFRESDPIRGFAWRNGNAAVYTKTPIASEGLEWYSDPKCEILGGSAISASYPNVTSEYHGGWQAVFNDAPAGFTYSFVSSGTYGTESR